MRNQEIRDEIKLSRVYYNEVAERLRMSESSFYRLLRSQLTAKQREQIFIAIKDLKKEIFK